MRRLIAATALLAAAAAPAAAADLARAPAYKAPVVVQTVHNWTGFYLGGHIGYGWSGNNNWNVVGITPPVAGIGGSVNPDADGFIGGAQIGANYQAGMWVLGLEGDFTWSGQRGGANGIVTVGGVPLPGVVSNGNTRVDWTATITGRVGVAFDNVLIYAKGGVAFAEIDHTYAITAPGFVGFTKAGNNRTGYTLGAGIEYALNYNWSIRGEYSFLDFGRRDYTFVTLAPAAPGTTTNSIRDQIHQVKLGVNYRF